MADDPTAWGAVAAPDTGAPSATPPTPPAAPADAPQDPTSWGALPEPQKNPPAVAPPPAATRQPPGEVPGHPSTSTPVTAGEMGRTAVRGAVKGVVGAISFPVDLAIEAEHAVDPWVVKGTKALSRMAGVNIPVGGEVGTSQDYVGSLLDRYLPPSPHKAGQLAESGISMLTSGGLSGVGERAMVAAPQLLKQLTPTATKVTSRAAGTALGKGYSLSPAYIGGGLAKQAQTIRGAPKLHEDMSAINEHVTDRLAREDLGLGPDSELEAGNFDVLRRDNYVPYEQARALTPNKTDMLQVTRDKAGKSQFLEDIEHADDHPGFFTSESKSFGKNQYAEVIEPIKARFRVDRFNVGEAIDEARALRSQAKANLKTYDPKANAQGYVQRKVAEALDREVERMAEAPVPARAPSTYDPQWNSWAGGPSEPRAPPAIPGLGQRIKAARTALAKIQNYEDATGAGGHIIAKDFVRMLDKGAPLSGNARTIAETAKNFPKDMQAIAGAGKGERGAFSAVDYLLGGTGLVTGEPTVAAIAALRPATGVILKTRGAQERMLRGLQRRTGETAPGRISSAVKKTAPLRQELKRSAVRGAAMSSVRAADPGSVSDMDEGDL